MDDGKKWKVVTKQEKKKKKPIEVPKTKPSKKNSSSTILTKTKKIKTPKHSTKEIAVPGDVTQGVYIPPEKLKKLKEEQKELELKKQRQEMKMRNKQKLQQELQQTKKESKKSLDQLKEEWNLEEYKEFLQHIKNEFETNHDARLKKLADYLIAKFKDCKTKIGFEEYDKPITLFDEEYLQATRDYLNDITSEESIEFYWFLVNYLFDANNTGKIATMLLIQIIAHQNYEKILRKFDHYIVNHLNPKKKKNFKDEKNVPGLMWCFFQTRKNSVGITLIWGKYLLPLLAISQSQQIKNLVINFLEKLVSDPSYHSSVDYSSFPPDYKILNNTLEGVMLSMVSGVINEELTSRLNNVYLKLKSVIFENESLKKGTFFPMLLNHGASKFQVFRNEALICLHTCLINDESCFDKWRDLYVDHLAQSNNLLVYIRNKWNNPKLKISDENLFSLLNHFMDINKKIDYGEWKFNHQISEEEEKNIKLIAVGNNQSIIKLKKVMSTGRLLLIFLVVIVLFILVSIYFYFNPLQN